MRFGRFDRAAVLMALRLWTASQTLVAVGVALLVAVLIGVATVLIPNPFFARDIPPVWWNYPVLIVMSVLTGMLAATYVRRGSAEGAAASAAGEQMERSERGGRIGAIGTVLAWFAVGCPVCNKIALLALGYTGALTFFAPLQPILAVLALALTGVALLWRLQGMVICPVPQSDESARV